MDRNQALRVTRASHTQHRLNSYLFIMIMIRLGDDGDEDENYIPVATESIAVHMCKVCRQTENCSKAKIVSNAVGPIAGAMISGSKCR